MVVAQLLIAAAVLGTPDVVAASDFLRGGYPTGETVTAACTLVLWVALVVAVAVQAAGLVRQAARRLARPRVRVGAIVVVGMVILAGGALRHTRSAYATMCCGSVSEAQQAAGTVP